MPNELEVKPALLTRAEIDWLLGQKKVSKLYERKIRHSINKKIETLTELELPLLADRGFSVTTCSNGVTIGSNACGLGSPSLAGRGIANSDEEVHDIRGQNDEDGAGSGTFVPPFGNISNPRVLSDMGLASGTTDAARIPASPSANSSPCVRIPLSASSNLDDFKKYLIAKKRRNITQIICYATKYGSILRTGNASELLTLSSNKRRHSMEALACLSKFTGCYDVWKNIRERYQLKWSDDSSIDFFEEIYASNNNYKKMIEWVKTVVEVLPEDRANILFFDTLTGLRPDEAIKSIRLIHTDLDNYLNRERMVLEHFRYRELFIRPTKNAFISVLTPQLLELAKRCATDCSWGAIYHVLDRKGMEMHMKYCRKIFATYVRSQGIDSEIVNLLQGRIGKDVFVRHYNRPDLDTVFAKVRKSVKSLEKLVVKS